MKIVVHTVEPPPPPPPAKTYDFLGLSEDEVQIIALVLEQTNTNEYALFGIHNQISNYTVLDTPKWYIADIRYGKFQLRRYSK